MTDPRVERPRRSAKKIVEEYAQELCQRKNDPHVEEKIAVLEVICSLMGWMKLFDRIRYRRRPTEQWWQRD